MTIYVAGSKPMDMAAHTRRPLTFWLKQIQKILGVAYILLFISAFNNRLDSL
jgi:hypothetical protein